MILLALTSCGPTACACSEEFYYAEKYPLAVDADKISDCMKLYYKEKGLPEVKDYNNADYVQAYYYFGNHPCHNK